MLMIQKRCRYYAENGVPFDWRGIEVLEQKQADHD